jgi:hypothetical protein
MGLLKSSGLRPAVPRVLVTFVHPIRGFDDQRLQRVDDILVLVWTIETLQKISHTVDASAFCVVGLNNRPRRVCGVRVENIPSLASV